MEEESPPQQVRDFNVKSLPPLPEGQHLELPDPPYDIEIGCGVGYHPIKYHLDNPDRTLVAIERTHERFQKFMRRVDNHQTSERLIGIRADAMLWIVHHIPPESVSRYFLLYPNPFPERQRWHKMPFMRFLIETMQIGGTLEVATNVKEYADEAKQAYLSNWGLECLSDHILPANSDPRTHFEKKYLERGEECRNLIFKKPEPFFEEGSDLLLQ